jgi:uncharacterized membrane protein YfcA
MDMAQIALAALGFLLAGVIKGTTGLGYSSCALPFLVSAVGLKRIPNRRAPINELYEMQFEA